jgi:small-conductance mechanosensitive channel
MFLGFWGIDFKSLLTSLSIVAAAIAIISKEYVSGIISGIIISFSKEINIDDYVKINEHKGKIIDINLTKISLLNEDDDIIYIPNDKVYMSEIINYTKKEIKKVSIDFELGIKYHTTIEQLERNLADSLRDFHQYIEPDSFNVKIVDVHHEYLSLKFQYKLKEINRDVERLIRKKTIRLIANSIKEV